MSAIGIGDLSDAQRAAVLDTRPRVLVSAGAGSGKTGLLVAYFVRALVDEGVPAAQLVAVTFTRKAAAELATRIRSSLESCGRSDLARSLDAATIGTIHSLCRRLVKEHALEAGIDPACSVLEAEASSLIKEELSREAWEYVVERAGEAELEVLASRRENLRKRVVPLYDRLRGMGWEAPQIIIAPGPPQATAKSELKRVVDEALAAARGADRITPTLEADITRLEECRAWLERPEPPGGEEAAIEATLEFFPSRKTRSVEQHFGPVRDALTCYRRALAEVRLRPVVSAMNSLLAEFHSLYGERKRERGLLDFADLELRARALVTGDGSGGAGLGGGGLGDVGGPSTAVLPGSRLLIDEFQDTNELQCSILERLGAARLLMVGDERQSIYRFRGADVGVFRRREVEMSSLGPEGPAGGVTPATDETPATGVISNEGVHRLDVNYRSRPEVLDFINRLFAHESFFGARYCPLSAGSARVAGPTGTTAASPTVEVLVVERHQLDEPDSPPAVMQKAEAEALAARIRGLIDDEGWRQRDIVVLLPAQTHVDRYRQALAAQGVDVYVVRGKGYYSQEEVADVASLLRLLVNPHDDLALVSALRSPLAGISDDGLYLLGREGRRVRLSLWEVVRDARTAALDTEDRRRLSMFVERIVGLRRRAGRPGLARLIDDAITICDYDVCLLALPEGKRRFANVRKLMRMASEFEALEGPDLAGFVDLLQSMGELSDREGSAPTLAEGEDVVRVMTIHQAKGLEFPVVLLAGLGSDVRHSAGLEFVVGNDGRMGVFLNGSQRKTYELHDLCSGPAAELVAEERVRDMEEDIRLLYVAMTRTQQRLILVGARPKSDKIEGCRIGRIAAALGLDSLPAEGESVPLAGLDAVVAGVSPPAENRPRPNPAMPDAATEPKTGHDCPEFLKTSAGGVSSRHVSFSALAAYQRCPRQFYLERMLGLDLQTERGGEDEGDSAAPRNALLDDDERHAGRDVGLLVHALLERMPVEDGPPTGEELLRSAQEWRAQSGVHLSPADADRAVALAMAFWESPLARLRAAPGSEREAPFFFVQGEVMVSGVMDLVCREREGWRIVDYKTNALEERPPAELAPSYEMQADVYCLAALRAGAPAVQMDLLFLESPTEPVTMKHGREDIAALESALNEALAGLARAEFPTNSGETCRCCSVAEVCAGMARSWGDGIQ